MATARIAKRQSIKDQVAVGRVFELKARHGSREPVCVMIVRDPRQPSYGHPIAERIDAAGMRRAWKGRFYAGSMRLSDFTSAKIARRRRDLERFDARDIALVNYGIKLDFTGKLQIDEYGMARSIPFIHEFPEIEWTIFSTCHSQFMWRLNFPDAASRLSDLLRGDWHFYGTAYKTQFVKTENQYAAWATTKTDPVTLAKIEKLLRRYYPDIARTTYAFRGVEEVDGIRYHGVGNGGPAICTGRFMAFIPNDSQNFRGITRRWG
jgi:hypothetical protein